MLFQSAQQLVQRLDLGIKAEITELFLAVNRVILQE
jgi:hypothetical protein